MRISNEQYGVRLPAHCYNRCDDQTAPPDFYRVNACEHKKQSEAQLFLDGCCAAVFLSKHSEQMPDCFFHKPLKKCLRHKILRHCLHAAPLNSPKVRLQMPHITGAMEITM
jgi:hypothetical protein